MKGHEIMCFKRASLAATAALLIGANTSVALPISQIAVLDTNNNGRIDRGAELNALLARQNDLNGFQQSRLGTFVNSGDQSVDITLFDVSDIYAQRAAECNVTKRFFLQESISGVSLLQPNLVVPSQNGALLSLSHNNLTNVTNWAVKGAIAWLPNPAKRCLHTEKNAGPQTATLTGRAIAPFLSFEGTGASNATSTSDLRVGFHSQFQLLGGAFDVQEISFSPYYRTDFDGKAEIYGATLNWTPYLRSIRLNGVGTNTGKPGLDLEFSGAFDYESVVRAGTSGLVAGTESTWVGTDFGVAYNFGSGDKVTLKVDAGASVFWDLNSNREAILYDVGIVVPLGDDDTTSIDLRYRNGTNRSNMSEVDGVTLNVRFSF